MKKTYQSPEMEVLSFASEDIVTLSGNIVEGVMNEGDATTDVSDLFGGGAWSGWL